MANATLVGFDVPAGEQALHALTRAGIFPSVALWAKTSDYDEPRLFLASPDLDTLSKLEGHGRIADAIQPEFTWSAPDIVILRSKDPFVTSLRSVFSQSGDVNGMRLGGQSFGDRYIEDAYVYLIR